MKQSGRTHYKACHPERRPQQRSESKDLQLLLKWSTSEQNLVTLVSAAPIYVI